MFRAVTGWMRVFEQVIARHTSALWRVLGPDDCPRRLGNAETYRIWLKTAASGQSPRFVQFCGVSLRPKNVISSMAILGAKCMELAGAFKVLGGINLVLLTASLPAWGLKGWRSLSSPVLNPSAPSSFSLHSGAIDGAALALQSTFSIPAAFTQDVLGGMPIIFLATIRSRDVGEREAGIKSTL